MLLPKAIVETVNIQTITPIASKYDPKWFQYQKDSTNYTLTWEIYVEFITFVFKISFVSTN